MIGKKLAGQSGPESGGKRTEIQLVCVASTVPQSSVYGLHLFYTFIYVGISATPSRNLQMNTTLDGGVDLFEGKKVLQRDLNRLDQMTKNSCMKFSKVKCQALYLGCNNHRQCYRLGEKWLESCSAEMDLGMLLNSQLLCQQSAKMAKVSGRSRPASGIVLPAEIGELSSSCAQHC